MTEKSKYLSKLKGNIDISSHYGLFSNFDEEEQFYKELNEFDNYYFERAKTHFSQEDLEQFWRQVR